MSDLHERIGRVLRFMASDGMAAEDPDVVRELLECAHRLADLVLADAGASDASQQEARAFLAQLESDAFERY